MANDHIPRAWLMTDERLGAELLPVLERMPAGAGVVFRQDRAPDRAALAARVAEIATRRGLVLSVAGDVELARSVGARFMHRPTGDSAGLPFSLSVHTPEEAVLAANRGAAFVFISPVEATASHPATPPLGPDNARALARSAGLPAIALGGMDACLFDRIYRHDFHGWAGIDAWLRI